MFSGRKSTTLTFCRPENAFRSSIMNREEANTRDNRPPLGDGVLRPFSGESPSVAFDPDRTLNLCRLKARSR